jgi:alpha-ketoglutarate-dependent taurine dioxygenase
MEQSMAIQRQQSEAATAAAGLPMTALPIAPVLGAEMLGVDLAQPLAAEARDAIRSAFLRHPVLVFRGQHLNEADLHRFALVFGEVESHAMKQKDGVALSGVHRLHNLEAGGKLVMNPLLSTTYFWHSDKSFLSEPSLATILHAVTLPPKGGDTQYANMTAAYAALDEATKRRIAALHVVQSLEYMRRTTGNAAPSPEEKVSAPPVVHPLVRTHPGTGEKSLYLGMYSSHIVELPEAEGRTLLAEMLAHATADRFVYTHQWRPGDVVAWDNRCLLHRAVANYELEKYPRVMMRVVVKGDVPY